MSKFQARGILALNFAVYMIVACVPVTVFVDLLRWLALPPNASFADIVWWGIPDPMSILIIFTLNVILIWVWAGHAKKIVNQRLMKGPRTRALEALKSKD
jgi:hypothetical protein